MLPSRSPLPFFIQLVCEFHVGTDLLSELLTALSELLTALSELLHKSLEFLSNYWTEWIWNSS